MVRCGGIRTLKEASSGTFHRALRRPYAKVLRLPIPPRARGTKYRPTRASNNRAPPQPSPPMALPQIRQGRRTDATTGTNWRRARWGHSRPPTPPNPRARSVTQGVVENGYALVSFAPSPFPTTAISDAQACFRETVAPNFKPPNHAARQRRCFRKDQLQPLRRARLPLPPCGLRCPMRERLARRRPLPEPPARLYQILGSFPPVVASSVIRCGRCGIDWIAKAATRGSLLQKCHALNRSSGFA